MIHVPYVIYTTLIITVISLNFISLCVFFYPPPKDKDVLQLFGYKFWFIFREESHSTCHPITPNLTFWPWFSREAWRNVSEFICFSSIPLVTTITVRFYDKCIRLTSISPVYHQHFHWIQINVCTCVHLYQIHAHVRTGCRQLHGEWAIAYALLISSRSFVLSTYLIPFWPHWLHIFNHFYNLIIVITWQH